MRDIEEFSDEEPHIEDRGTKVKDYEEHSLTTEERDEIIRKYNAELSIRRITPDIGDGLEQSDKSMTDSGDSTDGSEVEEIKRRHLTKEELAELIKEFNESFFRKESTETSEVREINDESDSYKTHISRDLDPEEVHRLYYEEKFSQRKVAEVLGFSRDAIQGLFKTQGWKPRPVGAVEKNIDHQEVFRLCVEEGRTKKEAAEILGCKSTRPINRVLKENDWKTPLEVKMETEIDSDEVHRLHYEESWSFIKIAIHYGYESKDIIQRLFREREWIPTGLARQIVYEFPSEIEEDHRIESSGISDAFEHLRETENISPLDVARSIEDIISSSPIELRVKWMEIQSEQDTKITEVLEDRRLEVESSLNDLLGISDDSKMKVRVGFVDGKLYIRKQDMSEYNWMNIYDNELFYFKSTEDKFPLVHEMRARLGLSTNTDLGKLIDQLTDRESAEGSGYSDIKECVDEHLRTETLHLVIDTTGKTLQDLQKKIHCIGRIRSGKYEGKGGIRSPIFPTDPEEIDMMFARFFGLGLSDGHIEKVYSQFIYTEKNPDRREIVIEHSKDFGDVHYHVKSLDNEVHQIQFACAFGRALERRGFPAGDKGILNTGLPEFIMNGSLQTICVYFSNLWPEDGCFTLTGPNNRGEFKWNRSVVVRDPTKESEYNYDSKVTEDHLAFFEEHGTHVEEDDIGFNEKIELLATTLEELTKSKSLRISSIANEIKNIVDNNQPKLLLDEIEVIRKTGVHAMPRFLKINYFIDTGRVSIAWRGRIQRKADVMRTALQMLPDDIRKRARVEDWMSLYPELKKQIERENRLKQERH